MERLHTADRVSTATGTVADVLKLEADFDAGPLATPTLVDITADGMWSGSSSRGRESIAPDAVFGTGSMTIDRDNTDNLIPPTSSLRGKHIRLVTRANEFQIFTGFIDKPMHDQSNAPFDASVTLECVDNRLSKRRATATELLTDLAVGLLPPNAYNIVRAFNVPFLVDPLATYDLMGLLQELMANELGYLMIQADGAIAVQGRFWRLQKLAGGAVATFSDTPEDDDAYPMLSSADGGVFTLSEPDEGYRDRIEFTGTTGRTQIAEDVPADFDPVALQRTTQCPDDNWMRANARFLLEPSKSKQLFWRRHTVRLWPVDDDSIIEEICALDLGDVVAVKATPVGADERLESLLFIESLQHRWTETTWDLDIGYSNAQAWLDAWGTDDMYLKYDHGMTYDSGLRFRP